MIKTLRSFLFGLIWLCAVNALAGSISFQQPVSLSTGVSPRGLVLGRFTGTSAQFLAVANFGSSTFIGQSTPLSIISKQTSTVQVFSPSPIGLTPFAQIPVGRSPRGLAVVPDTSGNDNLLVSCYDSALLQMYRWNGSQFLKMDESPTLFQPVGVCYGITKAGGVPFVVVANYGANQISIYEIKNGKFGIRYDITVPAGPTQVAVGDLHGDGINEIVVACLGTGQLAILSPAATSPNDLSTFTVRQTLSPAPGADLSDLRIVDLNHDGRSDLVASDFAKSIIWIYLQQKDGTFVLQPPLTTNRSHPNGLTVADLDKTGFPVIIVADRDSDLVDLYQWNGINCQPLQSLKIASDLDSNFGPVEVAALDTTGSGLLDLVTTHPRCAFRKGDICDPAAMKSAFSDFDPDIVIHLAAETHVDRSIDGPGAFVHTNVVGTYLLLQAALAHSARSAFCSARQFSLSSHIDRRGLRLARRDGRFRRRRALCAEFALCGIQSRLRSSRARLASHLRAAGFSDELLE